MREFRTTRRERGGGELTREIRIKIELFRSSNILNDE